LYDGSRYDAPAAERDAVGNFISAANNGWCGTAISTIIWAGEEKIFTVDAIWMMSSNAMAVYIEFLFLGVAGVIPNLGIE